MPSGQQLIPDVWSVIFANLEPCFLAKVMRVSKAFNAAASSDTVFFDKMKHYFPDANLQTTTVPASDHKAKSLFKSEYTKRFSTLRSSASRRLLSFIIEEDIEQIRKFDIDGDELYDMLREKDTDNHEMFYYANRARNPAVRKELMNLYMRTINARKMSWNPFWIIKDWTSKKLQVNDFTHRLKEYSENAYRMAGALGDMEILKILKSETQARNYLYRWVLNNTIMYGHVHAFEFLLDNADQFKVYGEYYFGEHIFEKPLYHAASYNQCEIVRLILASEKITQTISDLHDALAASIDKPEVFKLCLDALLMHPKCNLNDECFYLYISLLPTLVAKNAADPIDYLLQKTYDKMTADNPERIDLFRSTSTLFKEVMRAMVFGYHETMEVLLKRLGNIEESGLAIDYSPLFTREINWGENKKGIWILLKYGYLPNQYDLEAAKKHPKLYVEILSVIKTNEDHRKLSPRR